jgi:RNA polymerase sigma factor (sigma-70 family)
MESEVPSLTSREIAETVLQDGEQRSRLVAYARSRFGIELDDAQDLLQETALELLRHRTMVRSPHGFTFKVFHTRCCRFLEARQANRRVFSGAQELAETACDTSALETADRKLELREVLETISSSCRRILLAYYVEGRSLRETAQAIPLPYPGVWNTISRCLRRLRACLA